MKRQKVPTYGHHKSTGQARVYVGGKSYYLGPFGSESSRIRYGEIVAKVVSGQPLDPFVPKATSPEAGLTVNEIVLAFMRHATAYYTKNGQPSDEVHCFKSAVTPLVELFGFTAASQFTPLALKSVRDHYVAKGWSRGYCNKSTNRIRHYLEVVRRERPDPRGDVAGSASRLTTEDRPHGCSRPQAT